ncbi:MAG: HNH endonuclease [Myxococcota bacterium]
MAEPARELGPCPLCGRVLIEGPTVDRHHLVPKSEGGKAWINIHRICHTKIHSLFSERELAAVYSSVEALLGHEEIQKFVRWVRKQPPEVVARHRKPRR